ncbi:MAG: glycosyltransferase family protein [Acidobacteriaceae bacterium]
MPRRNPIPSTTAQPGSSPIAAWMLFPVFFVAVFLSHLKLLRLPYYWDEAGYYIPAAYDFFRTGSLIPISTLSNAHPPLPSILLAAWWHLSSFVPSGTRTFMCLVTAFALLGVYQLARTLAPAAARDRIAFAVTLLTAIYSVWFAQSTLAHADMFAAAFTLWGLSFYFKGADRSARLADRVMACVLFSLSALSKETAIITPLMLAGYEAVLAARTRHTASSSRASARYHLKWLLALLLPILPLAAWYAYHKRRTGFFFGNPEYLRYNATANFTARHVLVAFSHRLMHVFFHMNMFVPVLCMLAAMLLPPLAEAAARPAALGSSDPEAGDPDSSATLSLRPRIPLQQQAAIGLILLGNIVFFSIMGGALLTRYLLPLYPLVLLECVTTWRRRVRLWWLLVAFSAVAFIAGIFINPPYRFAPEDNLNYSDMILLQQQAIHIIISQWPQATVLTTWPATDELSKPELGYVRQPIHIATLENFSLPQLAKAADNPGAYDTALIFSTRFGPVGWHHWGGGPLSTSSPDIDFESRLTPRQAAFLLHGTVAWQARRQGLWIAVLRFNRSVNATVLPTVPDRASDRTSTVADRAPHRVFDRNFTVAYRLQIR